jgi:putative ABC transport system permease protein
MRDLLRDAIRSLAHDRRFTVVAVALLAVTIGLVTAVYAIVHAVVLRPFPFADQDRLAVIWQRDDRRAQPVIEVAYGEMQDWRARSRSFDDLAVIGSVNWNLTLVGPTDAQPVPFAAVSASFFRVTGAFPAIGRALQAADEEGAIPRAMVISHGLWMRRFGGNPGIVGRPVPVRLDAGKSPVPIDIVGVMPPAFDFPRAAGAWLPAAPLLRGSAGEYGVDSTMRWLRVFYVLGRLRSGVSVEGATRELTQVMRSTDVQGGPEPPSHVVVTQISAYLLGPAGPVLWTLLAGAVLMLAIACANVAGLQVSRSARRQRVLAIRMAVGASGWHVVTQMLIESALVTLAALAGAIGVALATTRGLVLLAPSTVPRLDTIVLADLRVLTMGLAAGFVTTLVSGLWPALVARRLDVVSVLAHGPGVAADSRRRRLQRTIVVVQVATAVTLLAGTALFVRTLRGLDRTVLGFDPHGLVSATVTPATDDPARWNAFYDALVARVERLPGIVSAGAVTLRPLSGPIGWDSQPVYPGQVGPSAWGLNPHTNLEVVTPGYFHAMGIRLVRGRLFTSRDTLTSPGVVVVSETAARRLWPGRDGIGERLRDPTYRVGTNPSRSAPGWQTVIGVVGDVRYRGLTDLRLDLYLPASQSWNKVQQLMVRARGNPADVVASVRAAAREIDSAASVSDVTLMLDVVAAESAPWRFLMRIFTGFAALAAVLAAVGLGAVIALAVAERRRELAIRAALGAGRRQLGGVVLRESGLLTSVGICVGLLGALALGRAVGHLLVGVVAHDPLALSAAAALCAAAAALASWIPARRAAETDPIEALRSE